MLVIGIAGGSGSGKTTVVKAITEKLRGQKVVVIPQDIADTVIERAIEIVAKENKVRDSLLNGASLMDTYAKIGAI